VIVVVVGDGTSAFRTVFPGLVTVETIVAVVLLVLVAGTSAFLVVPGQITVVTVVAVVLLVVVVVVFFLEI